MKTSKKIYNEYKDMIDAEHVDYMKLLFFETIIIGALCMVMGLHVSVMIVGAVIAILITKYTHERKVKEISNRYYVSYLKAIVKEEIIYTEKKRRRREKEQNKNRNKYRFQLVS